MESTGPEFPVSEFLVTVLLDLELPLALVICGHCGGEVEPVLAEVALDPVYGAGHGLYALRGGAFYVLHGLACLVIHHKLLPTAQLVPG